MPVDARVAAQAGSGASLAEQAVMAVRELIHDGQLLPGQPIRQVAIAERLGMSRVPLREALQNLQAEGLVRPSATGGFVVTRLSSTELAEFYLMRRLLETELL
ncbi:MAG TPA: GntR family transcriptional regulator, partial [Pseudonocardia sp.]|nr:GntR family transcriptional regulator [Pseudonocardia sp.]